MKYWYAIYVKPRAEKKVSGFLLEKEVEHYIPLQKSLRQWSDRKKWVETPAVSGYVFVKIRKAERLNVLQTDFVLFFVRNLGQDAVIPEDQIILMKKMLGQTDFEVTFDFNNYAPGEPVRVIAGPLVGLTGNLVLVKNKKKLAVRFEQINVNMLVEIPVSHVAVLKNQPLNH